MVVVVMVVVVVVVVKDEIAQSINESNQIQSNHQPDN